MDLMKPVLPKFETYRESFEVIDRTGVYSNNGPFFQEFRRELAQWLAGRLRTPASVGVALTTNGTTAIELALKTTKLSGKKYCLAPSYTFVATIHAIKNSGLEPVLADINEATLMLSPEYVRGLKSEILEDLAAIIVVSAFGAPVDLESWELFSQDTGIPVVIDAAAAITSLTKVSRLPICVSLHATKTLAIGEGGVVISSDHSLVQSIVQQTSFGFANGDNEALVLGGNFRLSEYSCAIGLAALNQIKEKEERYFQLASLYKASLEITGSKCTTQSGVGEDWVSSTFNVVIPELHVGDSLERLDAAGIPWRRWWGFGVHKHNAFRSSERIELTYTDSLAPRVIGVPFHLNLTEEDVLRVTEVLR